MWKRVQETVLTLLFWLCRLPVKAKINRKCSYNSRHRMKFFLIPKTIGPIVSKCLHECSAIVLPEDPTHSHCPQIGSAVVITCNNRSITVYNSLYNNCSGRLGNSESKNCNNNNQLPLWSKLRSPVWEFIVLVVHLNKVIQVLTIMSRFEACSHFFGLWLSLSIHLILVRL